MLHDDEQDNVKAEPDIGLNKWQIAIWPAFTVILLIYLFTTHIINFSIGLSLASAISVLFVTILAIIMKVRPATWLYALFGIKPESDVVIDANRHKPLRSFSIILFMAAPPFMILNLFGSGDDLLGYWQGARRHRFDNELYLTALLSTFMVIAALGPYPRKFCRDERVLITLSSLLWNPAGGIALSVWLVLRFTLTRFIKLGYLPALIGLGAGGLYMWQGRGEQFIPLICILFALLLTRHGQRHHHLAAEDGRILDKPDKADPAWVLRMIRLQGLKTKNGFKGKITHDGNWDATGWQGRVLLPIPDGALFPSSLYLRIMTGAGNATARQQVDYYTKTWREAKDMPIPLCYDYGLGDTASHVVLQDLSQSHQPMGAFPPDILVIDGLAEALAKLHAVHWQMVDVARGHAHSQHAEIVAALPLVTERLNALLSFEDAMLARSIITHHPALLEARLQADANGQTRLHGALTPNHVMVPRFGDPEQMGDTHYLLAPTAPLPAQPHGLATADIAQLLHHLPHHIRREHEARLLERWQAGLAHAGIDYTLDAARHDYRLALPLALYDHLRPLLTTEATPDPDQISHILTTLRDWGWDKLQDTGTLPELPFIGIGQPALEVPKTGPRQ